MKLYKMVVANGQIIKASAGKLLHIREVDDPNQIAKPMLLDKGINDMRDRQR